MSIILSFKSFGSQRFLNSKMSKFKVINSHNTLNKNMMKLCTTTSNFTLEDYSLKLIHLSFKKHSIKEESDLLTWR